MRGRTWVCFFTLPLERTLELFSFLKLFLSNGVVEYWNKGV